MKSEIKPPIILKTLLDILFWVLIFIFISAIPLTIIAYLNGDPINVKDYEIEKFTFWIGTGLVLSIINSGIFIYIVYLLRKVVRSFFKRKLFTPLQIAGLNLIGKLIIFTSISEIVINMLLAFSIQGKARVGISFENSFDSLWFTLALGLFFILLSQSFRHAKNLQEENDLTV